jgi:hypothetical protein
MQPRRAANPTAIVTTPQGQTLPGDKPGSYRAAYGALSCAGRALPPAAAAPGAAASGAHAAHAGRAPSTPPTPPKTGYVVCDPGITVDVASTADVVTAVKKYLSEAARAGQALKIRASRHKFHTTTSMACPDQQYAQPNGTVPHGGVLAVALLHDKLDKVGRRAEPGAPALGPPAAAELSTAGTGALTPAGPPPPAPFPAQVLEVDPATYTMKIGAGMRLSQFLEAATAHKMSVMVRAHGGGRGGAG